MLSTKPFGMMSELAKAVSATDTVIQLSMGDGHNFKVGPNDHFYVTLRNGSIREYVKVTSVNGDKLTVQRGADSTTPTSFPKGSCVKVEWNPSQLCEFVQGCTNGDSTTSSIEPQTICWTCDTCITIDDKGHITSVNGGSKC